MRWTQLAAVFAACSAIDMPGRNARYFGQQPAASHADMQLFQGRLFSGQGWWNRYGEPVNATAMAQAETVPPITPPRRADAARMATAISLVLARAIARRHASGICGPATFRIPSAAIRYGGHHGRRNCNDGCNSCSVR